MSILNSIRETIAIEKEGLDYLAAQVDETYTKAIEAVLRCTGKVVVTGMGKSGLVGQKIAATLASTGTASFFVHPGEAAHGDMGMISKDDVLLMLSYSGETEELLRMLAFLEDNGNPTISITGNPVSTLASNTDYHLNGHIQKEACPLELAPTTSTTAALVIGDALAVALMNERGFKKEDFARFHPGGSLGRKLLTKVGDVMRSENLPFVENTVSGEDLLLAMSAGKLGLAIVGSPEKPEGVITDGDLRRGLVKTGSFKEMKLKDWMTKSPLIVDAGDRIVVVEAMLREKKITAALVSEAGRISGVYQIFS